MIMTISEKKRQSLPNFYRYRTVDRNAPTYNIYESTAPLFFSSPSINVSRSKSADCINEQLLRQGLDAVGTPQKPQIDTKRAERVR
jgi:hypothetical protein